MTRAPQATYTSNPKCVTRESATTTFLPDAMALCKRGPPRVPRRSHRDPPAAPQPQRVDRVDPLPLRVDGVSFQGLESRTVRCVARETCDRDVVLVAIRHRRSARRPANRVDPRLTRVDRPHFRPQNPFVFAAWFRWLTTPAAVSIATFISHSALSASVIHNSLHWDGVGFGSGAPPAPLDLVTIRRVYPDPNESPCSALVEPTTGCHANDP